MRYRAGRLERASGALIAPLSAAPVVPSQADRIYTAAVHHGQRAWVHDVAADAAGRPVVTYAAFPTASDHRYHYARWTGSRWEDHEIARAGGSMSIDPQEPHYSGGITLDHEDRRWCTWPARWAVSSRSRCGTRATVATPGRPGA
jgi:hypothetical protein